MYTRSKERKAIDSVVLVLEKEWQKRERETWRGGVGYGENEFSVLHSHGVKVDRLFCHAVVLSSLLLECMYERWAMVADRDRGRGRAIHVPGIAGVTVAVASRGRSVLTKALCITHCHFKRGRMLVPCFVSPFGQSGGKARPLRPLCGTPLVDPIDETRNSHKMQPLPLFRRAVKSDFFRQQ